MRPACHGSRSPVRAGAGNRPSCPVPSLPGLNPRRATRPCRHSSPRRRSPEMMWPRPVTPTPGHPHARAELPPRRRSPPAGDSEGPLRTSGAGPLLGSSAATSPLLPRQELSESAPALRRRGGPGPRPPAPDPSGGGGARPPSRRPHLRPRQTPAAPHRSCPAHISPAAQRRGSPHTPEPPGTGCGTGDAGSCSPAGTLSPWAPRHGELQPPACPAREGLSEEGGACAELPKRVSVSFVACGGRCPEPLTGRRGAARGGGAAPSAALCAPSCRWRPAAALASPAPAASSLAKTWVRASWRPLAVVPAPASRFDSSSALPSALAPPAPGPPQPFSPSAPLSVHLSGAWVARCSPAEISPGPRTRPFIAAQEILDRVCHRITLVLFVAALTW
ncbi:uncharacterized protein LOC135579188 [Columba livia]|uniref:uncharacterized protein LOC135579188 n=1 Tax=Columba livia TaxID=8932 RepID=UPI0031BB5E9C